MILIKGLKTEFLFISKYFTPPKIKKNFEKTEKYGKISL